MAIKKIVPVTDNLLKTVSDRVVNFDGSLRQLNCDLIDTMKAAPGAGLSAIQIGIPQRVLVANVLGNKYDSGVLTMVNPVIVQRCAEQIGIEEGCLSVPNYFAPVNRAKSIDVKFQSLDGQEQIASFDDICSIIVQHEMDHLDGIVFLDHLSRLKRETILRKVRKDFKLGRVEKYWQPMLEEESV